MVSGTCYVCLYASHMVERPHKCELGLIFVIATSLDEMADGVAKERQRKLQKIPHSPTLSKTTSQPSVLVPLFNANKSMKKDRER